jgi:pimeloyl-ACP methyl ester carboxylesterase
VSQVPAQVLAALAGGDDRPPPDPQEAVRSARGSLLDLEALAASTDVSRWAEVRVPSLLMQGSDTWEPIPSGMDALAAALPDAERVVFPGESHFATSTSPAAVADILREFLRRHSHRSPAL